MKKCACGTCNKVTSKREPIPFERLQNKEAIKRVVAADTIQDDFAPGISYNTCMFSGSTNGGEYRG